MTRIGLACLVLAVAAYARPDVSWLVRSDARAGRVFLQPSLSARPYPGEVARQSEQVQPPGFGVYALEFGGAIVGTCIAAVAGIAVDGAVGGPEWNEAKPVVLGLATYAVSSALLSSAATHLVGHLTNHRRPYSQALIGGAVGGLAGGCALLRGFASGDDALVLVPVGLVLPPLGAVIGYNVSGEGE
jgi:hypothetical protein